MSDTAAPVPDFLPDSGACLATLTVLDGVGLRWMVRDQPTGDADNGWRFMSQADSSEYLSDNAHWKVVSFNQVCAIEPAVIGLASLPVGSDLQLVYDDRGIHIVDTPTGREIPRGEQFPHAPRVI